MTNQLSIETTIMAANEAAPIINERLAEGDLAAARQMVGLAIAMLEAITPIEDAPAADVLRGAMRYDAETYYQFNLAIIDHILPEREKK